MPKTINGRIFLWYVVSVFSIIIVAVAAFLMTEQRMTEQIVDDRLKTAVLIITAKTQHQEEGFEIVDQVEEDGLKVLVYDSRGHLIRGSQPEEIGEIPLGKEGLFVVDGDGLDYYFYEGEAVNKNGERFRIRSYIDIQTSVIRKRRLDSTPIGLLPVLFLLVMAGGYLTTRHALAPIQKIRKTAEEITQSGDLHRRIELDERKEDELTKLADTFNRMFQRIEDLFGQEKQLTSDASHELRNPVAVILAQTQYLIEQLDELKETQETAELKETAQAILRQSKRMQKLVSDLLMVSRMENGVYSVKKEPVDVSELTEMVAEEMRELADAAQIEIRTEITPAITIHSSVILLIRVLTNLISNAIKYGRSGGFVLVRVTREEGEDGFIRFMVEDNGIGIAPEHLKNIWNRFYMVDPSQSRFQESTGLGLFLVKRIIEYLGGDITVQSTPDVGSRFTFRLPQGDGNVINLSRGKQGP